MSETATPSRSKTTRKSLPAKASGKAPSRASAKSASTKAALTISSKNYSSWSLRGWLLARFVELDFDEVIVSPDDADARKELLLLAPSIGIVIIAAVFALLAGGLRTAGLRREQNPEGAH